MKSAWLFFGVLCIMVQFDLAAMGNRAEADEAWNKELITALRSAYPDRNISDSAIEILVRQTGASMFSNDAGAAAASLGRLLFDIEVQLRKGIAKARIGLETKRKLALMRGSSGPSALPEHGSRRSQEEPAEGILNQYGKTAASDIRGSDGNGSGSSKKDGPEKRPNGE